MSIPTLDDGPQALQRQWVRVYSDYLLTVLGLKTLMGQGQTSLFQLDLTIVKMTNLLELTDQLHALGTCPVLRLAGDEAKLWRATMVLVESTLERPTTSDDLAKTELAWQTYCEVVGSLNVEDLALATALHPRALQPTQLVRLFHDRHRTAFPSQEVRQFASQGAEPTVILHDKSGLTSVTVQTVPEPGE